MTGIKLIVDYTRSRQKKIADVDYAYVVESVAENASYFPHPRGEGKKKYTSISFGFLWVRDLEKRSLKK